MCGIVGLMAPSGWRGQELIEVAREMADTLRHRGPDGWGAWEDPEYPMALAHRRLSIQDLSAAGHQPMASASGRYHIVFNGEIYNFKLLAEELRKRGHRFRGSSDTEVLVEAFDEWGIQETLKRSQGMFAMGIWDRKTRELILCRDRMGEKPLFLGWLQNCFVFASELKAIGGVFRDSLRINEDALAAFFRFGYVPTPHCIYENVFKLMPGTYLRIPAEPMPGVGDFYPFPAEVLVSPQPYWQIEDIARKGTSDLINDEREAVRQFDTLLRDAIRRQKIADVPIGAFLSGGVDSSLVAAIMQAVSNRPINTFTIGFKEKAFDEAPYARAVARHIGSHHHEYYASANDGLALVEDIPHYWDEPFADSSQIPSLMVAKMARQNVTVCLTGDGGDELFCGYNRYFTNAALWSLLKRAPKRLRQTVGEAVSALPPKSWQEAYILFKRLTGDKPTQANVGLKMQKLADILKMNSIQEAYLYLMSYWHHPEDAVQHSQEASSILDRKPNPSMGHFISDAMYWDQVGYLVDDNLVKGDRASMAVSLEMRMPLLDHRVVEFSWRLPLSMKYRKGQSKCLLRQTLYRYVPKRLIERPKMGFSVPISAWLKGPLRNWVDDLMHSGGNGAMDALNRKTIHEIWKQQLSGSHDHSNKLWVLCMWLAWCECQRVY